MRPIPKKTSKITEVISKHIKDNLKSYIIVAIILLIGIILGVFFINNLNGDQQEEVRSYLTSFSNSIKDGYHINQGELLKKTVGSNLALSFGMWFAGSTVIGIPIVLGIVAFHGFCIGYTISASIAVWGTGKGILFFATSMLTQNLIFIPCILALSVSGIKLYKSIMKDKRKENIKMEVVRHTVFSFLILILLIFSALVETYVSANLLTNVAQYL